MEDEDLSSGDAPGEAGPMVWVPSPPVVVGAIKQNDQGSGDGDLVMVNPAEEASAIDCSPPAETSGGDMNFIIVAEAAAEEATSALYQNLDSSWTQEDIATVEMETAQNFDGEDASPTRTVEAAPLIDGSMCTILNHLSDLSDDPVTSADGGGDGPRASFLSSSSSPSTANPRPQNGIDEGGRRSGGGGTDQSLELFAQQAETGNGTDDSSHNLFGFGGSRRRSLRNRTCLQFGPVDNYSDGGVVDDDGDDDIGMEMMMDASASSDMVSRHQHHHRQRHQDTGEFLEAWVDEEEMENALNPYRLFNLPEPGEQAAAAAAASGTTSSSASSSSSSLSTDCPRRRLGSIGDRVFPIKSDPSRGDENEETQEVVPGYEEAAQSGYPTTSHTQEFLSNPAAPAGDDTVFPDYNRYNTLPPANYEGEGGRGGGPPFPPPYAIDVTEESVNSMFPSLSEMMTTDDADMPFHRRVNSQSMEDMVETVLGHGDMTFSFPVPRRGHKRSGSSIRRDQSANSGATDRPGSSSSGRSRSSGREDTRRSHSSSSSAATAAVLSSVKREPEQNDQRSPSSSSSSSSVSSSSSLSSSRSQPPAGGGNVSTENGYRTLDPEPEGCLGKLPSFLEPDSPASAAVAATALPVTDFHSVQPGPIVIVRGLLVVVVVLVVVVLVVVVWTMVTRRRGLSW